MKDILIKRWITYAQADLDFAELSLLSKSKKVNQWTYVLILWHCHQAVEKILKTALISQDKEVPYIHDIAKLLEKTDIVELSDELVKFIDTLNAYYIRPRYPDMHYTASYPKADRIRAQEYFQKTKEIFVWLRKYISRKKS